MHQAPIGTDAMQKADYWLESLREPDEVLQTPEQVREQNVRWEKTVPSLHALSDYPEFISHEALVRLLTADRPPDGELFDEWGRAVDGAFWEMLSAACATPQPDGEKTAVHYGFAVKRLDVRTFPTGAGVFRKGQGERFDRLQETAWPVFEPLVILHHSKDGRFVYAQSRSYKGWTRAEGVAETDRETFHSQLAIFAQGAFATVLERSALVYLPDGETREVAFATRLPLADAGAREATPDGDGRLAVWWPVRDGEGRLNLVRAAVAQTDAFPGHLPCTRRSLIGQAFKLLGESYGWGGACGLHDCSSFVMDIYRTVGMDLPRNTDDQEAVPSARAHRFAPGDDIAARMSVLSTFRAGDALYMPGHTMVWLGLRDGRAYVIHDYSGYAVPDGSGGWMGVPVQSVGVMPLDLHLGDGRQYVEALTSAVSFTVEAPPDGRRSG